MAFGLGESISLPINALHLNVFRVLQHRYHDLGELAIFVALASYASQIKDDRAGLCMGVVFIRRNADTFTGRQSANGRRRS
ncbi:hypothetical protein PSPTOT1_2455 [Pseudomonas syringae pv. tomato T1]|nr:hypothetical protein PSPTOT1_2455 [Pseudomonas syringae pv. tomato T1]RMQ66369.1 hypothetical protein ALQ00_200009 [Pseudomonas syringae pv. tomato]